MSALSDLKTYMKGQVHAVGATPASTQAAVEQLATFAEAVRIPDKNGATVDGTYMLMRLPNAGTINKITVIPEASLTANDTTYKTLTFGIVDGAGGGATVVGTQTTKATGGSGSWVAATALTIPLTATVANLSFTAGKYLQLAITHASTGVAEPIYTVVVEITET